jgi:GT2 family glycosyltransferase
VSDIPVPISVVIPTSRGGPDLGTCLEALANERYPGLDVVVVDNGTQDSLGAATARFPGIRVIRNEDNVGFAVASNQGIEGSREDLVLLLNDDAAVEPGALRAMAEAMESHPRWGACQAKLVLMDDPSRLDTAGSFLTATGFLVHRGAFGPEAGFTLSDEIFTAKGAAFLARRAALAEVGLFDPDFFAYFEESDLCWRLWLAGWEVGFAADARVRHRLGSTASRLSPSFVQFHSFKNRLCSLLKNLGAARLSWMLPVHVLLCIGLAGGFTVRGRADVAGAILRAIAWNARHLRSTLRKRTLIQRRRRISDGELMPRIVAPTSLRLLFGYAKRTAGTATS